MVLSGSGVEPKCMSKLSYKPDMWSYLSKKEASTLAMLNRKLIIEKRVWNLEPKPIPMLWPSNKLRRH